MRDIHDANHIYTRMIAREGLYGQAYFGHRTSASDARRLNRLWRRARHQARRNRED